MKHLRAVCFSYDEAGEAHVPVQVSADHLICHCYMTRIQLLLNFVNMTVHRWHGCCVSSSFHCWHAAMTHTYWTCAFLTGDCSSAFAQWESLHFSLQSFMIEGGGETGARGRLPEQLAFFCSYPKSLCERGMQ